MKTLPAFILLLSASLALFFSSCRTGPTAERLERLDPTQFRNPSDQYSVHTWWHWMDNSITESGITKDLEAMKKQGITTATILNVGLLGEADFGVPHVKFGTERWFEMFRWALQEADRLGMKIGIHNCDGWSTSGGPWMEPANSMKQCIWRKVVVKGGEKEYRIAPPQGNMDFYRDIKIVAFPATEELSSFQKAHPQIEVNNLPAGEKLYDGNPFTAIPVKEGSVISINLGKKSVIERLCLHPRRQFLWVSTRNYGWQCELKSSDDGKTFRSVKLFDTPEMNKSSVFEIDPVEAQYFRLEFRNLNDYASSNAFTIAETELLAASEKPLYHTEIPFHLQKTATTKANGVKDIYVAGPETSSALALDKIVDVTSFLRGDSLLAWEAPAGNWAILRIGYTTTGMKNGPSTIAGRGLECDKMDTAALNLHFKNFGSRLVNAAGDLTGKTFEYLFIDSWECQYQNWTQNFPGEFEKRRGYPIFPWLPVICGETVGSSLSTERFLNDFRQTIADLIEQNYYSHFADLCKLHNLKSHAEVIYGGTTYPPLEVLGSNRYMDVPMYEFWASPGNKDKRIAYQPVSRTRFSIPAFAGALYGKMQLPAEAYTGHANYSETPWELKLYGDNAYCSGINQMVLHSYVHQPFEKKPGFTLGIYGQAFNRHSPWWEFSLPWFIYQRRIQYVLQNGITVADILCFTGDRFNNADPSDKILNLLPAGIQIQKCNRDILENHCKVRDGKLFLDNGNVYSMILLPEDTCMEPGTLQLLAGLVKKGATLAGPRPTMTPGNSNSTENDRALKVMTDKLWGEEGKQNQDVQFNLCGKGRVYNHSDLAAIVKELNIEQDFSSPGFDGPNLLFIHKKCGGEEVYFVVNQENRRVDRECIFRVAGKFPEIWDPQYGTVHSAGVYTEENGKTAITTTFQPKEALFFVFREKASSGLAPLQAWKPLHVLGKMDIEVLFEGLPDKGKLKFDSLVSWTQNSDPSVRYYSGKADYTLRFDLPEGMAGKEGLFLTLGDVRASAEAVLNGHSLGSVVFPGFRFSVSGHLKEKENVLQVKVAGTFRNRIIGDFAEYGELKNCWSTAGTSLPDKGCTLQESGLLGPVTLMIAE